MTLKKPKCADCGKATDRCIRRHPHGVVDLSLFLCAELNARHA